MVCLGSLSGKVIEMGLEYFNTKIVNTLTQGS